MAKYLEKKRDCVKTFKHHKEFGGALEAMIAGQQQMDEIITPYESMI